MLEIHVLSLSLCTAVAGQLASRVLSTVFNVHFHSITGPDKSTRAQALAYTEAAPRGIEYSI